MGQVETKLQFVSDLHLEFYQDDEFQKDGKFDISKFATPCAEYLAILGDLSYPTSPNFEQFLETASQLYKKVFYVAGNHEYYIGDNPSMPTMSTVNANIEFICSNFANVYYLNNEEHLLNENTVILGTTLWSHIPDQKQRIVKDSIKDYTNIFVDEKHYKTGLTCKISNQLHTEAVLWLTEKLKKHQNKKVIILSHHMPSFKMISPQYKDSDINCAFATDLDYLMWKNNNIKFWLCGHTHSTMKVKINKCICMTNPIGYPSRCLTEYKYENDQYDKALFITI